MRSLHKQCQIVRGYLHACPNAAFGSDCRSKSNGEVDGIVTDAYKAMVEVLSERSG